MFHNCGLRHPLTLGCLFVMATAQILGAANLDVNQDETSVAVTIDGMPFTTYHIKSKNKPILWPIVGPTGKSVTRGYPMKPATEAERADHPHHRSLWFTHGEVNGTSYWDEGTGSGSIVHKEFLKVEGGEQATIITQNDWVDTDGSVPCSDVRTIVLGADEERRWIDFDITITAGEDEVVFGDTKEGSFGMRVAGTMKVEAENGGHIVNNQGDRDKDTWGKRASWVDYYGPVGDETLGIAILNHPTSFRFPTYWHVRTYGLFAANVFGVHNFENIEEKKGAYTLEPGKSITFRYRILLHQGDEKEGNVADAFVDYAKVEKHDPQVEPQPVGAN